MKRTLTILVIALFFTMLIITPEAEASYSLEFTGAAKFQAQPWVAENFTGYVIVGLGADAQSELEITLSASGDIAQWLVWDSSSTFTIYPDQQLTRSFTLAFPASAPDKYNGELSVAGVPPQGDLTGGAVAPGNIGLSIGASIDVPARLFFESVNADANGANSTVINGRGYSFSGNVSYGLELDGSEIENHTVAITNLSDSESSFTNIAWSQPLQLGVYYDIVFYLIEVNVTTNAVTQTVTNTTTNVTTNITTNVTTYQETLVDVKNIELRLRTPSDIIGTWHLPTLVYADYDATIHAIVYDSYNGLTECRVHYTIDGGAEQTGLMIYDGFTGIYVYLIDNTSYQAGSKVEYWVTSYNNEEGIPYSGTSDIRNFWIYPSTAPDLAINESSFIFSPINPNNESMTNANSTSIFITIQNSGRGDIINTEFVIEIFDYNTSISRQTISNLASGSSGLIRFDWTLPESGPHLLRFVVDSENVILETNENNNYYSFEVEIEEAPYVPPPPPETSAMDVLPYILIPIILIIILLFLRRPKTINVTVSEVKPFKHPKEGTMRWKYTCSYGANQILGTTKSTDKHAEVGTTIQVKPIGLFEKGDGSIIWSNAEVVKILEGQEPDTVQTIRKQIKKENRAEEGK